MSVRVRRRLDSDTLQIPELRALIGREVEIVVQEVETPQDELRELISEWESRYKLHGSVLRYDDPSGPATPLEDWEALQ